MKKMSLVVIEDQKLLREMYKEVFARHARVQITGEAGDPVTALEIVNDLKPDIVLLDLNLSPANGFDLVPLIIAFSPGTKIICISMHANPVFVKKMIQAGAFGFITKNSSRSEMLIAVDEVLLGNVFLSLEIKEKIARNIIA